MRHLLAGLLLLSSAWTASLHAQVGIAQPVSIADIEGNSAAQQVSPTAVNAKWVLIIALTANSAAVRVGDANVGASRGSQVAAGGGLFMPPLPPDTRNAQVQNTYDLSKIYFYGTAPDKISVIYGR